MKLISPGIHSFAFVYLISICLHYFFFLFILFNSYFNFLHLWTHSVQIVIPLDYPILDLSSWEWYFSHHFITCTTWYTCRSHIKFLTLLPKTLSISLLTNRILDCTNFILFCLVWFYFIFIFIFYLHVLNFYYFYFILFYLFHFLYFIIMILFFFLYFFFHFVSSLVFLGFCSSCVGVNLFENSLIQRLNELHAR